MIETFIERYKVDDEVCDGLIEYFEENVEYKNQGQVGSGEIDKKVKDSTDVVFWTGSNDIRIQNFFKALNSIIATYGKKYALGNLLLIDDTEDADAQKPSKAVDKIKQAATFITPGQMQKAKEYIAAGGNVEAIETKYKLTDEQRKNLTEVKK